MMTVQNGLLHSIRTMHRCPRTFVRCYLLPNSPTSPVHSISVTPRPSITTRCLKDGETPTQGICRESHRGCKNASLRNQGHLSSPMLPCLQWVAIALRRWSLLLLSSTCLDTKTTHSSNRIREHWNYKLWHQFCERASWSEQDLSS